MSVNVSNCPAGSATGGIHVVTTQPGHNLPNQGIITHTLHIPETNNNNIDKTAYIIKVNSSPTTGISLPVFGGGKGKRGPSGPIVTTSDEDESPDSPLNSPRGGQIAVKTSQERAFSPPFSDHDYENVSSPGSSSTASGPTYVRQPGFTHHAHEVTVSKPRIKKKKTALISMKDGLRRRDPTPPKNRPKRESVPMRMRALPQSFWQQPNVPHNVSPSTAYPILPPLFNSREEDEIADVRPITPPPEEKSDKEKGSKPHRITERKITVANTDLLFKLFDNVEKDVKKNSTTHQHYTKEQVKPRTNRSQKVPVSTNKSLVTGEDPYLVDGVTDKLFPDLRLEQTKGYYNSMMSGTSLLHVVTLKEGDKCISLPALSVEQNYSQMLSELVAHI